jgi:hypothetical protein
MGIKQFFEIFVFPFMAVLIINAGKFFVDDRLPEWKDANDTALDIVLLAAGAITLIYTRLMSSQVIYEACIGDAAIATVLLGIRFSHRKLRISAGWFGGIFELILGAGSIIWVIKIAK